jgi:alanine dehydrogenase
MILIDFDTVHRLTAVKDLIQPLRHAFASTAVSPERMHLELGPADGERTVLLMPSWRPQSAVGVKIVAIFPDNAQRALPTVNATYVLMSWETGQPLAIIDGRALTLLRTAAVSAVAADILAPPQARSLLMVGTGAMAPYLIEAHLAIRNYTSVSIWGRDQHKAADVARRLEPRGWRIGVAADLQSAVRDADVISCATLAERPLIEGAWLKPVSHLDLVGSFTPGMREADDDCLRGAFVAIDTEAGLLKSGDLIKPLARGVITRDTVHSLGDLVSSRVRNKQGNRTVFKSVGVAHADLASAQEIFGRYIDQVGR